MENSTGHFICICATGFNGPRCQGKDEHTGRLTERVIQNFMF